MQAGKQVIVQAALRALPFTGRADILRRIETVFSGSPSCATAGHERALS